MATLAIINPPPAGKSTKCPPTMRRPLRSRLLRRAPQLRWQRVPLTERKACIERFRHWWYATSSRSRARLRSTPANPSARPATSSTGCWAVLTFPWRRQRSAGTETVFDEGGMREQIEHVPLGVVGNISAWNYPWFVGGNVFVPALLTGNTVLYKPSSTPR